MLKYIFKTISPKPRTIRTTSAQMVMLGTRYPIKIVHGNRNKTAVNKNHIEVTLFPPTKQNFLEYTDNWYRRQARREFENSLDKCMEEFERLDYQIPRPQLKIYGNMRRAWGRCFYTKGVITLNLRLYRMPKECIDYILMHEMAHFIAHDHGALFHGILDKADPQWRAKEALLRKIEQQRELLL